MFSTAVATEVEKTKNALCKCAVTQIQTEAGAATCFSVFGAATPTSSEADYPPVSQQTPAKQVAWMAQWSSEAGYKAHKTLAEDKTKANHANELPKTLGELGATEHAARFEGAVLHIEKKDAGSGAAYAIVGTAVAKDVAAAASIVNLHKRIGTAQVGAPSSSPLPGAPLRYTIVPPVGDGLTVRWVVYFASAAEHRNNLQVRPDS